MAQPPTPASTQATTTAPAPPVGGSQRSRIQRTAEEWRTTSARERERAKRLRARAARDLAQAQAIEDEVAEVEAIAKRLDWMAG